MTKFVVYSDLHTEMLTLNATKRLCRLYFKQGTDSNLILAGDVGKSGDRKYSYVLQWCSHHYKKVFIIAGNHEFYHSDLDTGVKAIRDACKRFANIYFLDRNVYCDENYIIMGCTLWTRLNIMELDYIKRAYNDLKYIQNIDINEYHRVDWTWLKSMLNYYKSDTRQKIVVTHHMPSFKLLDDKYKTSSMCNSAFANTDCEELMKQTDYWIYGHTHTPRHQVIDKCVCVCNPIGYPGENETALEQVITL